MPLDLTAVLALITDADNSTSAADVRDTLRALFYRLYGIDADPGVDDVYWDGSDLAAFTQLSITGSQTLVEGGGRLSVRFNSQAAGDYGVAVKPVTLAVGSKWRVPVNMVSRADDFTIGAIVFTDGVTAASKFVSTAAYTTNSGLRVTQQEGTLTALAAGGFDVSNLAFDPARDLWLELEYVAANTFAARVGDGQSFTNWGAANRSFTMTPTHVGVGWTKNGGGFESIVSFGPLRRIV